MITREIVIRGGQPVWRICSGGLCVESPSGTQAASIIEAMERSAGIEPTGTTLGQPRRGPEMVPDPGV